MAHSDPAGFAQANLLAKSGRLSRAHMQYLSQMQQSIRQQEPKAIQAGRQVEDGVGIVHSGLRSLGIDAKSLPNSDAEQALAELESGLRDHLIATQQAKNGASLSADEARSQALNYLVNDALYGKGSIAKLRRARVMLCA